MNSIKGIDEEIIKAFKVFMKVMIVNSACDFKRAYYTKKLETIPFDEYVENKVSLSMFDDDAFFIEENDLSNLMKKIGYNGKVTKKEKIVLKFLQSGYSKKEIATITGITINSIDLILSRLRKKIRRNKNDR